MRRDKPRQVNADKNMKKEFNIKTHLKDFVLFVNKNLIKTIVILLVIGVLLVGISLKFVSTTVLEQDCVGTCRDGITLGSEYAAKIQVLLVTLLAGLVPYLYAPIVGFVGYVLSEVSTLAYAIKGYGYLIGVLAGIVPLLLNLVAISTVTALGIYICKSITLGYRISNAKNMNWLNFRIELYTNLQKAQKVKELTKQKEDKLKKLQSQKEKINYLQILNTLITVCIIQFMAVLIQHIVL